jgi:hypothetical protein
LSTFVLREEELIIHHQEAARGFGIFQRTDFALAEV